MSVLTGTAALSSQQAAVAAPGNPGTPSAGSTVYAEDFQNVPNATTVQTLAQYAGATGQRYTANNAWLRGCNGLIASQLQSATNSTGVNGCANPDGSSTAAQNQQSWNRAQQLAYALGRNANQTPAQAQGNYATSAYTAGDPGAGLVEFQTASNIPFTASNRFITFSVDVAATSCTSNHPLLQFQLLNSAGTASNVGSQIDGCATTKTVQAPSFGSAAAITANVDTYTSNGAQLFSGSSIGVRMINNQGSGRGNDHAFDNIRILDVTPQLDKSFSPTLTRTGSTSTLTFTVTNTSELGAKNGWSFTDALPVGLTVAAAATGGTCTAMTTASGSNIAVTNGALAAGQTSCTITVPVTSTTAGTYNNCPTTNVTTTGLNQPACAAVTFADPSFTVSKTADKQTAKQGDTVAYTVAVKNTGQVPYTTAQPATFSDDLSKVIDDATYNGDVTGGASVTGSALSWSGALAVGESKTITYSVTVDTPDTGDKVLTNTVVPGDGGSCDPASSCTTTTKVQSYTITKTVDRTEVIPGQKVTYTVTVENTGAVDYTAADLIAFTDDLWKVTDDATYNDDASSGATVDGNTLSWSGPLAVGGTQTITYSFTVNDPDTGDKILANAVVPNDPTACVPGACSTTVPAGSFTVSKVASSATVTAGDTVTYTLEVRNTGQVAFTDQIPATLTDDLSQVLDDATYNDDATSGATVTGNTLSWSGPLAVGATQAITYAVTVNSPDPGDGKLRNTVRPGSGGSCDPADSCITNTLVRQFTVEKTATATGIVHPGDTVTYTVTVRSTGTAPFTTAIPASFTDDLSKVLDDATVTDGPDQGATIAGNTLSWSGPLGVNDTVTVAYVATVNTPDAGDKQLTNAAVPGTGGSCATEAGCETSNPVGIYTVEKSSSATGPVHPGDTVTYTVTVTNTGAAAYTDADPASITDDLSKVLDDATYVADSATNGAKVSGTTLTWAGPLEVGGTQSITYRVRIGPAGTGDGTLTNVVTGDPDTGGSCVTGGGCTTTSTVQALEVHKTTDVTEVTPGAEARYTVTVTNTGAAPYTAAEPAAFTDDLSDVLDDATYNGDATNGATYTSPTLSWSGPLAVGATETITYSVTVNTPDTGDKQLKNAVVTPPGSGGNCAPGSDDPACRVNVPDGSYTVTKAADKETAKPGDTVTYTVTVINTGAVPYTAENPAAFRDDRTNVLDDATYNKDATQGTTVDGNTLAWSGPLAVGQTVKVTYSVTVNQPDTGNHRLVNMVVPTTPGGGCDPDGSCMTDTPVKSFTVTKTVSTTQAVKPGTKVGYTVTVKNTGAVAFTTASPASFTDDMSDVLDDATYNDDATNGSTLQGTTLTWSGPLKVGETTAVHYSVTVKPAGSGNGRLINTVDGSCDPAGTCQTGTPITGGVTPPTPPSTPTPTQTSTATPHPTVTPNPTNPGLAFTGTELVGPGLGLAVMLLALGSGLLIARRRRHNSDEADNA